MTQILLTRLNEKLKPFSSLQVRDCFTSEEKLYMKTDVASAQHNAVNLVTGKQVRFNHDSNVKYHPEVEIRVK